MKRENDNQQQTNGNSDNVEVGPSACDYYYQCWRDRKYWEDEKYWDDHKDMPLAKMSEAVKQAVEPETQGDHQLIDFSGEL